MFVEFLIRNCFRVAAPGHDSHRCMMHLLPSVLQTIFLIRSLYVKSQSSASTSNATFWWALQTQTRWSVFEPARTHHLGLKKQRNLRTQYLHLGLFLWKQYIVLANYKDFCKLRSFWLCTPLLTLTWPFFSSTYLLKLSSS